MKEYDERGKWNDIEWMKGMYIWCNKKKKKK
jgi:hypothetical protein